MKRDVIDGLEMEWIEHSPRVVLLYAFAAILTIGYYAGSFVFQYGNYTPRKKNNIFGEFFLKIF